ncbi:MAG: hypothetical protein ACR2I2_18120 [Bryobacteraceae bacterium]
MQRTDWESAVSLEEGGESIGWSLDEGSLRSIRCNLKLLELLRENAGANPDENQPEREGGGLLFGTIEEEHNTEGHTTSSVSLYISTPETGNGSSEGSIPEWIRSSRWQLVGLYRIRRGFDTRLDQEDRKFAATYLKNPAQVFLLIHPTAGGGTAGSLFVRGDGHFSEAPALSFPFDPQRLAATASRPSRGAGGDGRNTTGSMAARIGLPRAYLWGATACIAAFLIFAFVRSTIQRDHNSDRTHSLGSRRKRPSAGTAGALGLTAFTESDHVRIKWDPTAPPAASTESGLLVIQDGLFENVIPLDSILLRQGTITYFPLTTSVAFELQVGSAMDFVSVTGIREATVVSPHAGSISPPVASAPNRRLPKPAPELGKLAAAQTRPVPPAPLQISELTSPPDLNPAPRPVANSLPQLPVPGGFLQPEHQPEHKEPIVYVGPESVKRISPKAPANIGRLLVSPLTIRVKVDIDRGGNVVQAESLTRGSPLLEYLSTLSVNAAQHWLFRPARRGDQAVDSETVLEFNFRRDGS